MKIIKPQPTEKNPYVVENYPYGFKRTKIRYWVESVKKKGDRFVSQTLNPKTQEWNKPKKGTYSAVIIIYKNEIGHIKSYNYYWSTSQEIYNKLVDFRGDLKLNELQEEQLKVLRAQIKTYKNVSFEIRQVRFKNKETGEIKDSLNSQDLFSGNWEKIEDGEHEKKQKEVKSQINKSVVYNYHHDKGFLN